MALRMPLVVVDDEGEEEHRGRYQDSEDGDERGRGASADTVMHLDIVLNRGLFKTARMLSE